jgi:parvulin-like peptidyl-prolyl isomerase
MSASFKGIVLSLLVAGALLVFWRTGGDTAAEIQGRTITHLALAEALRDHLWKNHLAWLALPAEARQQTRGLVLEAMVNDRLIRAARLNDSVSTVVVRQESDMMRRQFADAAEYPQRLAAQQQTQQSLDVAIREAQLDEQWIARQIASRLAEVTDKDVRAWYDEFKESLRIPQAHHAAHIFLTRHDNTKPDREPEIREIHRQLMAKDKTFAALAAAHSDDDRSKVVGGDLGWFTRERMPADFIAVVEKLKIGQFSDPVSTKLGWHLIIVMERRASRLPTFEEVKDEIAALLTSQRREAAVKSLIAELRQTAGKSLIYHSQVIDRTEPAP